MTIAFFSFTVETPRYQKIETRKKIVPIRLDIFTNLEIRINFGLCLM